MLLASVIPVDILDTKVRPRGWRSVLAFYRPPAATPLSLSLAQWALSFSHHGGQTLSILGWLLAWPRRAQYWHCVWCHWRRHARGRSTMIFGKLAKLPLSIYRQTVCYKRIIYVLYHPGLHLPLNQTKPNLGGGGVWGPEPCRNYEYLN